MSNFIKSTRRPDTGAYELAEWIDDYFGRHLYGVRFKDGKVFKEEEILAA